MEQVAGVFRARYNRQAKVIRVQWLVILILLLALAFSLAFRPFTQRKVVSPAPTPAPQQAASTPQVETASPEPPTVLVKSAAVKTPAIHAMGSRPTAIRRRPDARSPSIPKLFLSGPRSLSTAIPISPKTLAARSKKTALTSTSIRTKRRWSSASSTPRYSSNNNF